MFMMLLVHYTCLWCC